MKNNTSPNTNEDHDVISFPKWLKTLLIIAIAVFIIALIMWPLLSAIGNKLTEPELADQEMIDNIRQGEKIYDAEDSQSEETVGAEILDTDEDGLSDEEEEAIGTDINNPDTDGDGYSDSAEVENGHNPLE